MSMDGVKFVRMLIVWLSHRKRDEILETEKLSGSSIPTVAQSSFNAKELVVGEADSHRSPVKASNTVLN
jgi:hypothetical protein